MLVITWQVCIQNSLCMYVQYEHRLVSAVLGLKVMRLGNRRSTRTLKEGSCNTAVTVVKYSLLWQDERRPSRKPIRPVFFCALWFVIFILQLASFVFSPCVR